MELTLSSFTIVWFVYKDLGTDQERSSIEFAKEIIGISSWDEVRHLKEIK